MNMRVIILIMLCLLNIVFIILINKHNLIENFQSNKYDFVKYCENTKHLNSNKLISRIRKVDKHIYKRNGITNNKIQHILVQDFKYFVDNELSNLKDPKIVNIVDHPFKSTCESTFNYKNFINNEYIEKVYCENWNDELHSKVIITPIGIESTMCNTLNNDELKLINISKNQKNIKEKPLKILSNGHLKTYSSPKSGSYDQRTEMYNKLKNNSLIDFWNDKVDRTETWKKHDNYSFELCPEGNGLDTHRFYEALYLNTIPIVKKNSLESLYRKFPCVIVNEWNEITEENCKKWKINLQDKVEKEKYKLYNDYWSIINVEHFNTYEYFKVPYRLGDVIKGWSREENPAKWEKMKKTHIRDYPNSLVYNYLQKTTKNNDIPTLSVICNEYLNKNDINLPKDNELIIHIRLGDVIEESIYSAQQHWNKYLPSTGISQIKFIKDKSFFNNILKKIKNLNINKIILIWGDHRNLKSLKKSNEYINILNSFLKQNGYKTSVFFNRDADLDFVYMSSSKYFVSTGGGFSTLIAKIVKYKNNIVLHEATDKYIN